MSRSTPSRFVTALIAALVLTAPFVSSAEEHENPHVAKLQKQIEGKEDLPAEEVFKNIEITKGIPAGRVLRIMEKGFAPALGVNCDFCHVVDHWEVDEKEQKRKARAMWRMVGGINAELKEIAGPDAQSVNCSTCHKGNEKPPTGR